MTTTNAQTHNRSRPCLGVPKTSMVVCNYSNRVRSVREMNTIENLVRVTCTGIFLRNNNPGFATTGGEPILVGASKNGAQPLVTENGYIGYCIDNTKVNVDPPEKMNTTPWGALVARNSFAHVAGPLVVDSQGNINYNLLMRGYNKNGVLVGRDVDDYFGLDLMHDGTDALLTLSSGSTTTVTDAGTPQEKKTVCFEDGETMRIRLSGIDTALNDRTLCFERRVTNSTEGGPLATWVPVMCLSA